MNKQSENITHVDSRDDIACKNIYIINFLCFMRVSWDIHFSFFQYKNWKFNMLQ